MICHIPFLLPPVTGSVLEKGSVSLGSVMGQCGIEPSPMNEQHAVLLRNKPLMFETTEIWGLFVTTA